MSEHINIGEETIIKERIKTEFKKPTMYKVIMLNDDYTTMDFVIEVLVKVFNKTISEATKVMFDVHEKGSGIAGVYTYDIGRTKIAQAMDLGERQGYPFKLILEEA